MAAIGVDLGASTVKAVAVGSDGRVARRERLALTDPAPDAVVAAIARACDAVRGTTRLTALGVAVPGVLDDDARVVVQSANLGWADVPLAERLEQALGAAVVLEKDGAAAALGEAWQGAGRGASSLLVVALGTGIGGGVVIGGRLWRGRSNYAGGLGHVVVHPGGPACACGARGCLEAVIAVRSPGAGAPGPALQALAAVEGTDPTAGARLQMALQDLAGVLATAVSTLNPERLIVGGGVCDAVPRLVDRIAELVVARIHPRAAEGLGILPAALGIYAGAVGAARLAGDLRAP